MAETASLRDAEARRTLKQDLARFNCRVHQADDPPLFSREPRSSMKSFHWKWSILEPLLDRLGEEIDLGARGPRRTLRLASPGLDVGTTPTFWASIQVILPGEIADAHRHSASAFRFVMRGGGATTTVDGEQYPMNESDLVLTPAWTWHDHEYRGREPMIWLDVLDISLMQTLHASFFEAYATPTQPVAEVPDGSARLYGSGLMRPPGPAPVPGPCVNPLLVYPASMALPALACAAGALSDPVDDVILEYQNPRGGGSAMPTMAMTLQTLRHGFRGQARRNTGSRLYYVVQGSGATTVGSERFEWSRGDFMTVAPWVWHAHENQSGSDAVLFQVNDLPVLRALGFYREEVRP
jgi:gentisate 1,2-dioxygenase